MQHIVIMCCIFSFADGTNSEIDRISETTKFNETYLLKGSGKGIAGTSTEVKPLLCDISANTVALQINTLADFKNACWRRQHISQPESSGTHHQQPG